MPTEAMKKHVETFFDYAGASPGDLIEAVESNDFPTTTPKPSKDPWSTHNPDVPIADKFSDVDSDAELAKEGPATHAKSFSSTQNPKEIAGDGDKDKDEEVVNDEKSCTGQRKI